MFCLYLFHCLSVSFTASLSLSSSNFGFSLIWGGNGPITLESEGRRTDRFGKDGDHRSDGDDGDYGDEWVEEGQQEERMYYLLLFPISPSLLDFVFRE